MANTPRDEAALATVVKSEAPKVKGLTGLHFLAGALGGAAGSVVTAPFDLVKTRLQSDSFKTPERIAHRQSRGLARALWHFVETGQILRDVARNEGPLALFRGLGPLLVGVVPSRAINFSVYGNGKAVYSHWLHEGRESPAVHLLAATTAGVATGTATNPIWVVKTRLQLQMRNVSSSATSKSARPDFQWSRPPPAPRITQHSAHLHTAALTPEPNFRSSLGCVRYIWATEGVFGFYRGLTASYLGVAETAIQWTLYEQFKARARRAAAKGGKDAKESAGGLTLASGSAKLIATTLTYPHEVVRTRMRQAPKPGQAPKYTQLMQTFRVIYAEEGLATFYSGLSPHLLRTVPNACVMFLVYEGFMRFMGIQTSTH